MNTEPLIDSDGQPTNPDDRPTNGGVSARKRTANRANSGKSTGPRSAMGKRIASQNSFKNGYYSNERRLQLMGELEEDPALRERRRQGLYESYPPGAPVEEMLLDDLTDHWYMRDRLVRLDASVKLRELQEANLDEWRREEQNESWAVDYVKSEISKGGLVRQKDCPGKFRLILDILGQLLPIAKSRSGGMDHQPLWKMLYGTNDANRRGEEMFLKFYQGPHMSDAEYVEVLGFLEDELDSYHRAWIRYKVEHQQETVASREARLVTCGGDALILFKEMEVTDRQIERKLQLLLKVRAERFAREKEESRAERRSAQDEPQPGTGASPDPNGETSPHHPEGGAAKIPPRKPVERGSRPSARQEERKAKGKGQKSKGKCEDRAARSNDTFDLQPSTFDFFKNEATDLPENKGSASAEIRNEATVESSRQSAVGSLQSPGQVVSASASPTASSEQLPAADCLLPTAICPLPTVLRRPPIVFCILTGEEPSALAGGLLCAGHRLRPSGSAGPMGQGGPAPCRARGSKHSLHASGEQPLPPGRANRAARTTAAGGREPGAGRLHFCRRRCSDAVPLPLPSGPCKPCQLRGGVRPERSRPHRRLAGFSPASHALRPSVRSGTGIGPKQRCRIGAKYWRSFAPIGWYRFKPGSFRTGSFREDQAAAGIVRRPRHRGLGGD